MRWLHRNCWRWKRIALKVRSLEVLCGQAGDDAKRYQEKDVVQAIEMVSK